MLQTSVFTLHNTETAIKDVILPKWCNLPKHILDEEIKTMSITSFKELIK